MQYAGHCVKCGGHHIAGPIYGKDERGKERLTFTCCRCGYAWVTLPLDARQKAAFDAARQEGGKTT